MKHQLADSAPDGIVQTSGLSEERCVVKRTGPNGLMSDQIESKQVEQASTHDRGQFEAVFARGCGLLLIFTLVFTTVFTTGCQSENKKADKSQIKLNSQQNQIRLNKHSDHLDRVYAQISNEEVTDWSVFESTVTLSLNNAWETFQRSNDDVAMIASLDWKRSPLLDTLPAAYQQSLWFETFESEKYLYTDALYLQEQYWLHEVVRQVAESTDSGRFAYLTHAGQTKGSSLPQALQSNDPALSEESAQELASALKLYDWTLRNVTGNAFTEFGEDEIDGERLQPTADDQPASFAGVRGPGYTNYLWQTLSYARGDVWEQTHLFLQLARNAGLDVCVLGLPQAEPSPLLPRVSHPDMVPWAIGVVVDSKMYLLEPRMGLPMVHPETLAVLTLGQLQAEPEILDWYSLTPTESTSVSAVYPVRSEQLKEVVALLDFPLESLSPRMQFVHENLVGESRLAVYSPIDESARVIAAIDGIDDVQLWALPLEINVFRGVVREAEQRSVRDQFAARRLQWTTLNEKYFDRFPMLRESRVLFLKGEFTPDQTGLKRDCLQELQQMRYTDQDISDIATDRKLQEALGLYMQDQSADEFSRQIRVTQFRMRIVRGDVQMFLAMAHQELRNFSTALNWLKLVKDYDTDGKWQRQTLYLEGRNHEAMRHFDQAMEKYRELETRFRSDRSPRDYGSVLRARIIEQQLKQESGDESLGESAAETGTGNGSEDDDSDSNADKDDNAAA